MSEEERGECKAARIVSITALVIGIATFLSGLLLVPATLWFAIIPGAGGDFDFIGMLLTVVDVSSFCVSFFLWPIAAIGLVLSIISLFIERDIHLRLLPLTFFIVGICFYTMFYSLDYIRG
ncbi:MAG: hypothetical protein GWN67_23710 [Phycisphaerae bacterium]|nr:hypothetical protein [Phycisphaerae bacterium]NIP55224.1 hypothetical protein [Phycisphaerae bacterium]NIS53881.1 hypothetical protein [Phycisphaerae bacterium]NIU11493.1 hypothetical protein [Phycisphaerae bacterium]NIU59276.1 hypothetical protein [Phycisphaerae bacterium]